MDVLELVVIFLLSAVASLVQSLSGLGFGLLIVPPLILVVGVQDAVIVSNVLATALSALLLYRLRAAVEWRMNNILLLGSIIGMPIGFMVLVFVSPEVLQVVIAIAVIAFTILLARGLRIHQAGLPGDIGVGIISGVLRTSTSMSGPPVVLYLQGRGMVSDRFRATLAAFFFLSGVGSVSLFALGGRFDSGNLSAILVGVPALAFGIVGGSSIYRYFDENRFRQLVFGVLILSSLLALVGAFF